MNEEIVEVLAKEVGPRYAYDTYARFIMNFGITVLGKDQAKYSKALEVY